MDRGGDPWVAIGLGQGRQGHGQGHGQGYRHGHGKVIGIERECNC
jgi:hypothetical protein